MCSNSEKNESKFSGKDLVKLLIQKNEIYTNLRQFLTEAEDYSSGKSKRDIVSEYLRASGSCIELLEVLQDGKKTPTELAVIFNVLEHILLRLTEDLSTYKTASTSIVQKILHSNMKIIHSVLNPRHKSNQIKSALKLLIAIAAQGAQATRELVAVFNFQSGNMLEIMNRRNLKDPEDVRTCFLHFIVALLVVGDNSVIRSVMEKKGFLNAVFHKLHHDRASSIHLFLSTVQNKIVENPAVSKTLKIRVLNDNTLKFVLELYSWEGARKAKMSGKRKFTSSDNNEFVTEPASEGEITTVRGCAHQFMLAICCSHKNGIIFHGRSLDNAERNPNHVITNLLMSIKKPYIDKRSSDFVVEVLRACPDQIKFYLPSLKDAVAPRFSTYWFQAMKFIKKIVSTQEPVKSVLKSTEKQPIHKIISTALSLCIPSVLPKDILTENLYHENYEVVYTLLDYIQVIIEKVIQITESSDTEFTAAGYNSDEITEFYDSFKKAAHSFLPDIESLYKCWEKILKSGQKIIAGQIQENSVIEEMPKHTLSEYIEKLVELFEVFSEAFREEFRVASVNYISLLHNIRKHSTVLPDKMPFIEIGILSLMANTKQSSKVKELQEECPFPILLNVYLKTDDTRLLNSVKKVLHMFLSEIGFSSKHEWEIDVWLKMMKKCSVEHHERTLHFLEMVLRTVMENPALCVDYIEETMKKDKIHEADNFSTNGNVDTSLHENGGRKNNNFQEFCSYLVPASIHVANSLSSSERKVVKIYLEEVFTSLLHHQHNPKAFCTLLHKCLILPVSFKNYINVWNLISLEKEKSLLQHSLPEELFKEVSATLSLKAVYLHIQTHDVSMCEKKVCKQFKSHIKRLLDVEELISIVRQIVFYINAEMQNEDVVYERTEFLCSLLKIAIFNAKFSNLEITEKNDSKSLSYCSYPDFLKIILNNTLMSKCFLDNDKLFASKRTMESSSYLSNIILTIIKFYKEISPTDFFNAINLYKNKVITYLRNKISPERRKPVAKDNVNFEELSIFISCFTREESISVITAFIAVGIKNIQKVDPSFLFFTQLVNSFDRNDLQSCLEIPSFMEVCFAIINSIVEKEGHHDFVDTVISMVDQHSNRFSSFDAEFIIPLLEKQNEIILVLLKSLLKCNALVAQALKEFLLSKHCPMRRWQPQFLVEIINICMDYISDEEILATLSAVSKHYWHAVKEILKLTRNENSVQITISKVFSLMLKEKLIAGHQLSKFIEKIAYNIDENVFPPVSASLLLKELFLCISNTDGVYEKQHILCVLLKIFVKWFLRMMKEDDKQVTEILSVLVLSSEKLDSAFINKKVLDEISWPSLLKTLLKNGLRDSTSGHLMLQLVKNVISAVGKEIQSNLSPSITKIHQMILCHSNFLIVMLEETPQNPKMKEALLCLLSTLTLLEPSVAKKEHVPIFLGSYHATLRESDQLLLYLINIYEEYGIQLSDFKPFQWGLAGINHYSVKKELALSLWKEPKMEEVVSLFDEEQMDYSLLHFPLKMKLEPFPQKILDKALEKVYDPRFLLPLFSSLLAPGCLANCRKFIESKCLSFVFMSLSSTDPTMRAAGYHVLQQYHDQLEGSLFKERRLWIGVIELIKNSVKKENTKLPCLVTLFLCKIVNIAFKAGDPMYWPLFQFISLKPSIDLFNVPEFYKLFNSTEIQQHIHQSWILTHLAEGLRTSLDFHICEKRYIFPILLTYYNSPISSQNAKMLILRILEQAIKIPSAAKKLHKVHGLLTWIIIVLQTSEPSEEELVKLKEITCALEEQVADDTLHSKKQKVS